MKKCLENLFNFGKRFGFGTCLVASLLSPSCTFEVVPFETKNNKSGIDNRPFVGVGVNPVHYSQKFDEKTIPHPITNTIGARDST